VSTQCRWLPLEVEVAEVEVDVVVAVEDTISKSS
jgi:hypothetical protein